MSDKNPVAARVSCIEQLMSKRNFEDLGKHLNDLETVHVTKEHLQKTRVVKVMYRVLKDCPVVALKKKAKGLLSKWKSLYKNTHIKPVDSPKSGDREENSGLSPDPSQAKILSSSSSDSLLRSKDVAKAVEMIVPETNTPEGHFKCTVPQPTGKSGELDSAGPVRAKCRELLYEALASSSTDPPKADMWQAFASEIEEHIFTLYSENLKKYKTCIRSKVSNLKNPRNSHLQQNLLSGTMSSREFAEMTVMDMASKELKQLRASYTESCILEHHLPQVNDGTPTKNIKCRRCENYNCRVTIISRGTIFLPSWVQNSNPDEDKMTFVICNECGEQWYHNRWVCL
ncbi:transcription elongation factor A N-terminal and central domain-containing protein isoform X2 [Tamandua tetradactyla]|uniref:transcription elongation factor A N-terminal and central domain-containing protein isoform X2 n=1 Tax=Tamandua tetradactyla TaxID=48850 RepID=UPI004053F29A